MRSRNLLVAGGLVLFGIFAGVYPVYLVSKAPKYSTSDEPLKKQLQIRGAYVNSGSHDVGRAEKFAKGIHNPIF